MLKLEGVFTALLTPFRNGAVDYPALRAMLEDQIAGGIAGVVPCGTTGESPSLSYEEHLEVIAKTVEFVAGRCLVIAGTGANSTQEAVEMTRKAKELGVDATLQVTPYYNKPTQEGLYRHFSTVADLGLPVVLYNVPSRTGVPIAVDTVARLAEHPNIAALKEAGGSVDRVSEILDRCAITVLSGDDSLTLPMIAVGARGIISVASHLIPKQLSEMVRLALAGDFAKAREIHRRYYRLFRDLFVETNPIPVKAALAAQGRIASEYRLPLCEPAPASREKLLATMKRCGVL